MEDKTSAERVARLESRYPLPENYQVQWLLGAGGFGQVIQCFKKDTQETVAVKIPGPGVNLIDESTMLNVFTHFNMDKCNIVRFIDAFMLKDNRMALACEKLDITLVDYLIDSRDCEPLPLHEIRSVIEQMATALNALKDKGIIHTDIKGDNIMLVDRKTKPIRVKLIDFGLALPRYSATRGYLYQSEMYRAPEISLGLPFSEAIDMWSLGIIMSWLMLGYCINQGRSRFDRIQRIVDLLGLPPDHLLNEGWYTGEYFIKTSSGNWRLKPKWEYWKDREYNNFNIQYTFTSLDELEKLPMLNLDAGGPDEKKECIDLLRAMLHLDTKERITPAEVLNHPFIKRGHVQYISDSSCGFYGSSSPNVIMVQSAPSDCCHKSPDDGEPQGESCSEHLSGSYESTETSLSHVIMVQSAPSDCCHKSPDDDEPQGESCSVAAPSQSTPAEYPWRDENGCPVGLFFAMEHGLEQSSELTGTMMADTDTDTEQKRTKKKKKNCIKRFFRWMKKTFCSCASANEDQD